MNDFLGQIIENTNKLQFNIDRKQYDVILYLRGRHYSIRSITIDPFHNNWNVIVLPWYIELQDDSFKGKTVDDIHYLNARKNVMNGINDDVQFVLVDGGPNTNYIPIGTLDVKKQTIQEAKIQDNKRIIYYFK